MPIRFARRALALFLFPSLHALAQAPQFHPPVVAPNSTLSGVTYNNRYEVYGGFAYAHFDAGPNVLQGANLGGFDAQAARFFTRKWAAAANVRGYYGTSGAVPNAFDIRGPFVSEHFFLAGPEYRAASNQHASVTLHALFGGVYGRFNAALINQQGAPVDPSVVGFFNNQFAFGAGIGGSIDLNRSPRLAFRISPDATLTNFSTRGQGGFVQQFALSVGVVYRLGTHIEPERAGAPRSPTK